jgi:thymidine phosphorylase
MTKEQLLFEQAEKAMQAAADGVVEEARRTHGTIVVWENGAVRHIRADELPEKEPKTPKQ